ncbi:MAG: hypothetical protein NVSMB52_03620 [Chloroflexota bacterium]
MSDVRPAPIANMNRREPLRSEELWLDVWACDHLWDWKPAEAYGPRYRKEETHQC